MDLYVCVGYGYLETLNEENRKEVLRLQSERINLYREYYIAPEERDVFWEIRESSSTMLEYTGKGIETDIRI